MESLKKYFYYTRSERRGAVILMGIVACALVIPSFIRRHSAASAPAMEQTKEIAEVLESLSTEKEKNALKATRSFFFNPNTASLDTLMMLGIPERTAKSLINYRSKGGKFRKPQDLQKIYSLSEADYRRLLPWIKIGEVQGAEKVPGKKIVLQPFDPNTADKELLLSLGLSSKAVKGIIGYRSKGGKFRKPEDLKRIYSLEESEFNRIESFIKFAGVDSGRVNQDVGKVNGKPQLEVRIDINRADAETWQTLRGIGPGFAGRICRFREALGGFTSVRQVAETKGLPDSTFQSILPFLEFSPVYRLLPINSATVEDLAAHPYLDYREASILVAYRFQHGRFESVADVAKVLGLKPGTLENLEPYLDFR